MGFGNIFKKVLFTEVDDEPQEDDTYTEEDQKDAAPTQPVKTVQPVVEKNPIDPKIITKIKKYLEEVNLPGYDLFELMEAVGSQQGLDIPEANLYKMVYSVAKSTGTTPEKIIESAQYYRDKLFEFKEETEKKIHTVRVDKVQKLRDEGKQVAGKVSAIEIKIQELLKEKETLESSKDRLRDEANANETAIDTEEKSFFTAFTAIVNKINDEESKVKTYLGCEL